MKRLNRLLVIGTMLALPIVAGAGSAPLLNGSIILRPLTPGDVSLYGLPAASDVSGGLPTTPVGVAVYLDAEVNIAIPASNITSVTWTLTNKPAFSAAVLTNSPLGTNVPIYDPSDRTLYQLAGRAMLRPDVRGQYVVTATITTTSAGVTNVSKTINAGIYMGVNTCALCHSGGVVAEDKVHPWQETKHAAIFTEGINGDLGFYSQSCLKCHTAGYNTNALAANNGFDDIAKSLGWTFPTTLTNTNWASMQAKYPTLASLGNIQCENCHGPGSEHAYSLGDTNLISKSLRSGDCNQCHDAPTHHVKGTEWYASRHGLTTGPTSPNCVGCHSADGFISRMDGVTFTNAAFSPLSCQACHEPHGETTPTNNVHLLRMLANVTMPDGTIVTNAGTGALCLQCHQIRNGSATNQLVNYPIGKPTWYGGSSFGSHDSPQGDMIEGVNAITYGQTIPSSAHRNSVSNLCVGCHMQPTATTDPTFLLAGGHTFNMTTTKNGTNYDMVAICNQCHSGVKDFDFPVADFNGDGIIEGVQTEVQHLLDKLSTLLPNSTYVASGNYVADGQVKIIDRSTVKTNWPQNFLKAAYNWQFVNFDASKGIHNTPFAVGLLKASIGDLTGDANNDGLADAWQIQYFGSTTSSNAAPNASPAGDGVPNWLKCTLGLNPWVAGVVTPDGVVWANGSAIGGGTNTIHIYTAAEVTFDTVVGKSYQVQGASALSAGWQNVSGMIPGTGAAISYVTPTRQKVQQFYRVVHTP